jgi:hypothetical protein
VARFLGGARDFLFSTATRLAMGPIHSPIHCVPGLFLRAQIGRSVNLTTHLHLVPSLFVHGVIMTSTLHMPSWRGVQLSTGPTSPLPVREICSHVAKEQSTNFEVAIPSVSH